MSEGKRPNVEAVAHFGYPGIGEEPSRELARYCLALEAALVKVTEALREVESYEHNDECPGGHYRGDYSSDEEAANALDACECLTGIAVRAYRVAAPLIANIPAPQKESR